MPLGSRRAVVEKCKLANDQSTVFMTVLKGNRYVVIWKCLEYISGDYTVNQYFTNSDSTWWARHNQVVPLGHPGHEWVKSTRLARVFSLGYSHVNSSQYVHVR